MYQRRFAVLFSLLVTFSTIALAQKADVAFVAGESFISDTPSPTGIACVVPCPLTSIKTDHHVFYEGTGAYRLANFKLASLHLEVPVAGIPSAQITLLGTPPSSLLKLSTVFVTPGLRVKFAPGFPISPWASVGGGWAHYNLVGPSTNKGALQFGGGIDIKTGIPLLAFRAEVRDFATGQLNFLNLSGQTFGSSTNGWRHNVLAGGGIVLRF